MTAGPSGEVESLGDFPAKVRFLIVAVSFPFLISCTSLPPKSLCFLDFINERCWVNKKKGIGPTFEEMEQQQLDCQFNPSYPCYYGLDSHDLMRIVDKLD